MPRGLSGRICQGGGLQTRSDGFNAAASDFPALPPARVARTPPAPVVTPNFPNHGNTCYAAVVLQVLLQLRTLSATGEPQALQFASLRPSQALFIQIRRGGVHATKNTTPVSLQALRLFDTGWSIGAVICHKGPRADDGHYIVLQADPPRRTGGCSRMILLCVLLRVLRLPLCPSRVPLSCSAPVHGPCP